MFRVIMPVGDIDHAARYYGSLLDEAGTRVSNGRHYFDCGGVILALYDPRRDGDRSEVPPNAQYVYFAVPDLETVFDRANTLGGVSTEIGDGNLPMGQIARRPWGERSFYLRDPFGNKLCFVDDQTLFTGGGRTKNS